MAKLVRYMVQTALLSTKVPVHQNLGFWGLRVLGLGLYIDGVDKVKYPKWFMDLSLKLTIKESVLNS